MIQLFRNLSIRTKLRIALIETSIVGLLLLSAGILSYMTIDYRRTMSRELSTEAEIVGANSSAALVFGDETVARETLSALKAHPAIVRAILYDSSGNEFARYTPPDSREIALPETAPDQPYNRFEQRCFVVFRPIYLGEDRVGGIVLACDLREQNARLLFSAIIIAVSIAVAFLISIFLSVRLQRVIADPLLSLAELAKRISVGRDYSLRAVPAANDETGALVKGFNAMLTEIEKRDTELRASEERFRQLAENIREVFWISDVEKQSIIYISPAYEQIWGRSCASVYTSPRDWMEAIHPDDRERIAHAACTRQATDHYNEEYRIVRPDGSMRWIHDRAFAIRGVDGKPYRIVGVAEDITPRKEFEKQILEISDREQSRFGQDLHDGLCQHLVRIGFAINVMRQELQQQGHPEDERAAKITELIDQAITQARNLARGLYPVKLETEGLRSALEELAGKMRMEQKIECQLECSEGFEVKEYAVAIHLYRIAQEAVTNAIKHARATRIGICVAESNGRVVMTISDNGVGMPEGASHQGMGLHIMQYRARMLGADFEVSGRPNRGTVVSCIVQSASALNNNMRTKQSK